MEDLVYVTGNYGKYIAVKKYFEESQINIDFYEHDFDEPYVNDIEMISKAKAIQAYNILHRPCFVADSGFYIDNYPNNPGYPGAFAKRSGISNNIDQLLEIMKDVENRSCRMADCLTFYDGEEFYTFYGFNYGTLSKNKRGNNDKKRKSNLWYVFIPNGSNKTLAEMTDLERANDGHTSATKEFINWYKSYYLPNKQKNLVLEIKKTTL